MKKMYLKLMTIVTLTVSTIAPSAFAETRENHYNLEKKEETVRVIIELEGETGVQLASLKGRAYEELAEKDKEEIEKGQLVKQREMTQLVEEKVHTFKKQEQFTALFNGFSGEISTTEISKLKKIPNVKNVFRVNKYKAPSVKKGHTDVADKLNKDMIDAIVASKKYGTKGEGTVIAVIDSGIDALHKDLSLTTSKYELTKSKVDALKKKYALKGSYINKKIPYAYNYADENTIVKEHNNESHGMHVSGIISGNGKESNNGVIGIAPEAQILALKVFSNDAGNDDATYDDWLMKAIDDAVKLGSDVINISIGSPSGTVYPATPLQKVVSKAIDEGVFFSIAGGNEQSSLLGAESISSSFVDIGTVSTLGNHPLSASVASVENDTINYASFKIDETKERVPYKRGTEALFLDYTKKTFDVIDAALGRIQGDSEEHPNINDFDGIDLVGKIALIKEGENTNATKAYNAITNGAVGVFLYSETQEFVDMEELQFFNEVPVVSISKKDAEKLKVNNRITFDSEKVPVKNPEGGFMSEFSSFGTSPELELIPDISAPGGNIYSSINNNKYAVFSGTSMAAPQVAGAASLLYSKWKSKGLKDKALVTKVKNTLSNTGTLIYDSGEYNKGLENAALASPRRQGAGMINVNNAFQTPVTVTDSLTGYAKVALKDFTGKKTFKLKATNTDSKEKTYAVKGSVQTDAVRDGYLLLESQNIYVKGSKDEKTGVGQFPIQFSSKALTEKDGKTIITIPAKSTVEISITVDMSNAVDAMNNASILELFPNGGFVEGFVILTDELGESPSIHVPYIGFLGNWNNQFVIDNLIGEEDSVVNSSNISATTSGAYDVTSSEGNYFPYDSLGYNHATREFDVSKLAISPNGDGNRDGFFPNVTLLRDASVLSLRILDQKGKEIVNVGEEKNLLKNTQAVSEKSYQLTSLSWEGTKNGYSLPDGHYYIRLGAKLAYSGAVEQVSVYPLLIDTKAPNVSATFSKETGIVNWKTTDELSGPAYAEVYVNGKRVTIDPLMAEYGEFELPRYKEGDSVKIVAFDYAGNMSSKLLVKGEATFTVLINDPSSLSAISSKTITISGVIHSENKVKSLEINGKKVTPQYNHYNNTYDFYTTENYPSDGIHRLKVKAIDSEGTVHSFTRQIIVDTTPAKLQVSAPVKVSESTTKAKINIAVADNFSNLWVKMNEENLYKNNDFTTIEGLHKKVKKTFTKTVALNKGRNTFVIQTIDISNNLTTKTIIIDRGNVATKKVNDKKISKEMKFLVDIGVVKPNKDGFVFPTRAMTRKEAVLWVSRALDARPNNTDSKSWKDMKASDAAFGYMKNAENSGWIVESKGYIKPNGTLTRAQMSRLISNAFGTSSYVLAKYKDIPKGHYTEGFVSGLYFSGIDTGVKLNYFMPTKKMTRAEFAVVLGRVLNESYRIQ